MSHPRCRSRGRRWLVRCPPFPMAPAPSSASPPPATRCSFQWCCGLSCGLCCRRHRFATGFRPTQCSRIRRLRRGNRLPGGVRMVIQALGQSVVPPTGRSSSFFRGGCGLFCHQPCTPRCRRFRQRAAQARNGFRSFRPPLFSPEARVCRPVPFQSVAQALAGFVHTGQLKGHHAVPRLLEELLEFYRRVRPDARLADARLDLFPVTHGAAF